MSLAELSLNEKLRAEIAFDAYEYDMEALGVIREEIEGTKLEGKALRIYFNEPVSFRKFRKFEVKHMDFRHVFERNGNLYVNTKKCGCGYGIESVIGGYLNIEALEAVDVIKKKYGFIDVQKRLYRDTWESLTEEDFHWHLKEDSMTPIRFTSIKSKFSPDILEQIKQAFENKTDYRKRVYGEKRDMSVEVKVTDGKINAWFSSEYAGCGNGDYYLLLNPTTAVFMETD